MGEDSQGKAAAELNEVRSWALEHVASVQISVLPLIMCEVRANFPPK